MTKLWSNKCYAEATLELPNFELRDVECSSNDDFTKMMTEELSQIEAKDIYDWFNDAHLEDNDRMQDECWH